MIENEFIDYFIDRASLLPDYLTEISDIQEHMSALNQLTDSFLQTCNYFERYFRVNSDDINKKIIEFYEFYMKVLDFVLSMESIEVGINQALIPYVKKELYRQGFKSSNGTVFTRD